MADIDLVVPMVFPADKEWQRDYARCHVRRNAPATARYRSWQTEELMIRCCMRYMPWLRTLYILLSGESQVQEWMKAMACHGRTQEPGVPAIRIVFHREFIPEEYLPCFSSPCIEMFLHGIPGLGEHFIYANDDMFPLSPLAPEDFFRPNEGPTASCHPLLPCQYFKKEPYPEYPNTFHRFVKNGLDMVARPFGRHFVTTWLRSGHSLAPYLKSSCEEVWRRHGDEIVSRMNPLWRDAGSYCQYIYGQYQHFAGLYVRHTPHMQYIGLDTPAARLAGIIMDPKAGIVCLNDNSKMQDWEQRAHIARESIAEKLRS